MKGRKRKPYLVALQDGPTHHGPMRQCPDASLGDFEPPFDLDAVARKEWDRMRVEAPWVLAVNALLLAERCRAFSELQRACQEIDASGLLVPGFAGALVKNPACAIAAGLRTFILKADAEMGLTPCSQSRVNAVHSGKPKQSIEDAMCG